MSGSSLAEQVGTKEESHHPKLEGLKTKASEPELQDLNAEIPKPLHKRAKMYATQHDQFLRDVLIEALREFLPE
jgi:hypothetical protein